MKLLILFFTDKKTLEKHKSLENMTPNQDLKFILLNQPPKFWSLVSYYCCGNTENWYLYHSSWISAWNHYIKTNIIAFFKVSLWQHDLFTVSKVPKVSKLFETPLLLAWSIFINLTQFLIVLCVSFFKGDVSQVENPSQSESEKVSHRKFMICKMNLVSFLLERNTKNSTSCYFLRRVNIICLRKSSILFESF